MRAYTEFLDKNPSELLTEAETEMRDGLLVREMSIQNYLCDFREYLEEADAAPMTIKGRLTGVRSFYKYYGIPIPVMPRSAARARPQLKRKEIPTKNDIREVLSCADPLEKAIVLTGVASGLAVNEISNLKVEEFYKGYDPDTGVTILHLMREKVDYEFYTLLTAEATQAVLDYIAWRNRTSDTNNPIRQEQLLKQKFVLDKDGKPTGYLFIGRYVSSKYLKLKESNKPSERKQAEELRKLETHSIQKIYRELNERASRSHEKGEWRTLRSHGIRKFTYSTLLAHGASIFFTDFVCGHQIDAVKEAYYRADPNALKTEYMKYAPYLTVEKSLDVSVAPEFQKLIEDNKRLTAEIERVGVEREELQSLRSEVDRLNQLTQVTIHSVIDGRNLSVPEYMQEIEEIKRQVREKGKL